MPDDKATKLWAALEAKYADTPLVEEELGETGNLALAGYPKLLAALEEHTKQHPPNRKRAICGLCKALATERARILEALNA